MGKWPPDMTIFTPYFADSPFQKIIFRYIFRIILIYIYIHIYVYIYILILKLGRGWSRNKMANSPDKDFATGPVQVPQLLPEPVPTQFQLLHKTSPGLKMLRIQFVYTWRWRKAIHIGLCFFIKTPTFLRWMKHIPFGVMIFNIIISS